MSSERQAPLRARLHQYQLTKSEFAFLSAMCEHSSDGSMVYAAMQRLATYAKLSRRHADRLVNGYLDPRTGKRVEGLIERKILTRIAKPGAKKRTAIYRINEYALREAPKMQSYSQQATQMDLPGVLKRKFGIPQQPITDINHGDTRHGVQYVNSSIDTVSSPLVGHGVQSRVDTVSTDSRSIDSRSMIQNQTLIFLDKQLPLCNRCGGHGLIHQSSNIPGPRLIPCPKCRPGKRPMGSEAQA